jgi:phosphoglycolate phosphatase-like HAD superfamily hydrolase
MKKVIAFDFDGTIIDSFPLINTAFEKTFHQYGKNLTIDQFDFLWGPNEKGSLKRVFFDDYEKPYKSFLEFYDNLHNEFLPPIDIRLMNILNKLKEEPSIHLVLLTGRGEETTSITFDKFKLHGLFEKCYFGSEIKSNKEDNFLQIQKDYNVSNEDILYIGDSLADIRHCFNQGIDIISVNYYSTEDKSKLEEKNSGNVICDVSYLEEKIYNYIYE